MLTATLSPGSYREINLLAFIRLKFVCQLLLLNLLAFQYEEAGDLSETLNTPFSHSSKNKVSRVVVETKCANFIWQIQRADTYLTPRLKKEWDIPLVKIK